MFAERGLIIPEEARLRSQQLQIDRDIRVQFGPEYEQERVDPLPVARQMTHVMTGAQRHDHTSRSSGVRYRPMMSLEGG